MLDGGEKGESVVSSLSELCNGSISLSSFSAIRQCLVEVLREEAEGPKLQIQLKSMIYRFSCSIGSREMIMMYLNLIANEHELSDVCVDLLQVLSSECSEFFMHWSIQVCLFGLHDQYMKLLLEGGRLKKKAKKRMSVFFSVFCEQSKEYEGHANVLLDEEGEWNEGYDSELLPLVGSTLDHVYSFPSECVCLLVRVMSSFCRFICSGIESTDLSLRESYASWMKCFVSNLALTKDPGELVLDLSCLSKCGDGIDCVNGIA